jgi:dTDP-4-amino-4,6-dideoxygalactose transaminase
MAGLQQDGIGTLIHYPIPPHLSGAYQGLGYAEGSFPIAERLARTVLSIPMGPHLTPDQSMRAVEVLREESLRLSPASDATQ